MHDEHGFRAARGKIDEQQHTIGRAVAIGIDGLRFDGRSIRRACGQRTCGYAELVKGEAKRFVCSVVVGRIRDDELRHALRHAIALLTHLALHFRFGTASGQCRNGTASEHEEAVGGLWLAVSRRQLRADSRSRALRYGALVDSVEPVNCDILTPVSCREQEHLSRVDVKSADIAPRSGAMHQGTLYLRSCSN